MRLAAYTGVMAARVAHEQQQEQQGSDRPVTAPSRAAASQAVSDPHLVTKLAGEGWLEHNKVDAEKG